MARKTTSSGSPRRSSSRRKPVTIDLEAKTVGKDKAEADAAGKTAESPPANAPSEKSAAVSGGKDKPAAAENAATSSRTERVADRQTDRQNDRQTDRPPDGTDKTAAEKASAAGTEAKSAPDAPAASTANTQGEPKKPNETRDELKKASGSPADSAPPSAKKPEPAKRPAPPPRAAANKPRSSLPLIAAAAIGGIVSLGGAIALDRFGVITLGHERPAETEALSALEASVATLSGSLEGFRSDVETRIGQFGEAVGDSAALRQEVDGLKAQVSDLVSELATGAPAAELPDLEPLETRIGEVEKLLESGGAGTDTGLEALQAKVSGALTQIESLGKNLTSLADGGRARSAGIAAVEERLAARIDTLQSSLDEISGRADLAAATADAAATAQEVNQAAETARAAARKADQAVAIAPVLAAEALQRALDGGEALESALDAFGHLGVSDPALEALRPYAASGLPTQAELKSEFDALAAGFAEPDKSAENSAAGNESGPVNRLLESAFSIVKVRRSDPRDGGGRIEGAAEVSAALAAGNLDLALRKWQALPDEWKLASQAWADKAKAVQGARQFAESVRSDALARLNVSQ